MRTLWVCQVAGGPFVYQGTEPGSTPLGLENAHREFAMLDGVGELPDVAGPVIGHQRR